MERCEGELDAWVSDRTEVVGSLRGQLDQRRRVVVRSRRFARRLLEGTGLAWVLVGVLAHVQVRAPLPALLWATVLPATLALTIVAVFAGAASGRLARREAVLDYVLRGDGLVSLERLRPGIVDEAALDDLGLVVCRDFAVHLPLVATRVRALRHAIVDALRPGAQTWPQLEEQLGGGPLLEIANRQLEAEGVLRWIGGRALLVGPSPAGPYRAQPARPALVAASTPVRLPDSHSETLSWKREKRLGWRAALVVAMGIGNAIHATLFGYYSSHEPALGWYVVNGLGIFVIGPLVIAGLALWSMPAVGEGRTRWGHGAGQ